MNEPKRIPLFKVYIETETALEKLRPVFESGYTGQGPLVEEFEQKFGALMYAPHPPLSVNSCTSALDLALWLYGVGPGDEVIKSPIDCTAGASVVVNRGARIIWADVDPFTGLIDPADVAKKITKRTKAIMAVDWGGAAANYTELKKFGIPVIEDAAHCNQFTGHDSRPIALSGGDAIAWSFQSIKFLSTGDGGALLLKDPDLMERGRLLRWFGLNRRTSASFRCAQNIKESGTKYHMNDVAAAIGLACLPNQTYIGRCHWGNAQCFSAKLKADGNKIHRIPPRNDMSAWWLYTILVDNPTAFTKHMFDRGIDVSPVHARNDKHDAFNFYNGPLPGVDFFDKHQISIPVGWWLTNEDSIRIVKAVEEYQDV